MLPLDAPVTPDGDEAQSWVTDELSRAEYGDEASPLTRAIRWVLQLIVDAVGGGTDSPPITAVILVLVLFVLALIAVAVIRNPIHLGDHGASALVFDADPTTREDARDRAHAAGLADDWDLALVWAFRVLVLDLAARDIVRDTPGLTAHEATSQASNRIPGHSDDLAWVGGLFDRVRYGTLHATRADVGRLDSLVRALEPVLVGGRR